MFLKKQPLQNLIPRSLWLRVFLFGVVLLGSIAIAFWVGMERGIILARHYGMDSPKPFVSEVLPHRFRMERNRLLGKMAQFSPMDIRLGHKALSQLEYKRAEALRIGYLIQSEDDWVNAEVSYEGSIFPASVRLKGDLLDHLKGDKWSLRVKLKDDQTLLGMKLFSVQHPKTRDYLGDWLFQEAAKREELIALRHHFIPLLLNGDSKGLYLLEEGFEKRLLEHNQHREGVILKFNENAFWQERREYLNRPLSGSGHYLALEFDSFQSEKTEADSILSKQLRLAESLLEGFRKGELKTSEVFEVESMARFVALADLFGVAHALHSNQFRFYLNPLDQRLHPIPYDAGAMTNLESLSCALSSEDDSHWTGGGRVLFLQSLFKDSLFFEKYLHHLNRMAKQEYLDALIAEVDEEIDEKLQLLAEEFPLAAFSWEVLKNNQLYMRQWLFPHEALKAHVVELEGGVLTLEVGNRQALPVLLLGLNDERVSEKARMEILGRSRWEQVKFQKISIPFSQPDTMLKHLEISWMIPGTDSVRTQKVLRQAAFKEEILAQRPQPSFRWFEGLSVDEQKRKIYFLPGKWKLNKPLVIPADWRIEVETGFELNLQNGAYVWSESPMITVFRSRERIRFFSSDSSGQGIYLHHPGKSSSLRGMWFENLKAPAREGWGMTGAVTVYDSHVNINNCHFRRIEAEDALNLVRSRFSIDELFIQNCSSDGLDIDFGKGLIKFSHFEDCKNDALDVSGSVVQIKTLYMSHIGDKGLSAGEDSRVTGQNLNMTDVWLGIAAKDRSVVEIFRVNHRGGSYGLTAYQKKFEFGGGKIVTADLRQEGVENSFLIERGSEIINNDQPMKGEELGVFKKLYNP
jgi:hypothetical protein